MTTKRRALVVLVWFLTIWELLTLGLAGSAKFMSADVWQGMFVSWGYPVWFTSVVGVLEITGVLLLLVPRVAGYAAIGLLIIMVSALITVIVHQSQLGPFMPVLHIVLLSTIALIRLRVLPPSGSSK